MSSTKLTQWLSKLPQWLSKLPQWLTSKAMRKRRFLFIFYFINFWGGALRFKKCIMKIRTYTKPNILIYMLVFNDKESVRKPPFCKSVEDHGFLPCNRLKLHRIERIQNFSPVPKYPIFVWDLQKSKILTILHWKAHIFSPRIFWKQSMKTSLPCIILIQNHF